jgi:MoaA/NifB/PqqE/SkfB family radical SAM enzyme
MKDLLGNGLGAGPVKLKGINLEVSSKCNLDCRSCMRRTYIGAGKNELMKLEWVSKLAPELKHLHSVDLTGWGEPLMNPEFGKILREIRKNFPGALSFTTNGVLLDENIINYILDAEVDTVNFSVDASDSENYRASRGKTWDKVEAAIRELVHRKMTRGRGIPRVYASFLLRRSRLIDLYKFGEKMSQLMLNGIILQQMTGVCGRPDLEQVVYSGYYGEKFDDEKFRKEVRELKEELTYLQTLGPEQVFNEPQGGCGVFDIDHLFIKANGEASPCCVLGYPVLFLNRRKELRNPSSLIVGNIKEQSLEQIWDSEDAVGFRKEMVEKGYADACEDCIGLYVKRT